MSCSHRKKRVVIEWRVPRKDKLVIPYDDVRVVVCDSCRGVSTETQNDMCFSRSRFDGFVLSEPRLPRPT